MGASTGEKSGGSGTGRRTPASPNPRLLLQGLTCSARPIGKTEDGDLWRDMGRLHLNRLRARCAGKSGARCAPAKAGRPDRSRAANRPSRSASLKRAKKERRSLRRSARVGRRPEDLAWESRWEPQRRWSVSGLVRGPLARRPLRLPPIAA